MNATTPLETPRAARTRRKVEAILGAARRLFREHGYAATSMDALALAADVSKATLYAQFPGKRELFAAVVQEEGDRQSGDLLGEAPARRGELRATLQRYGRTVQELLTSEQTIASYRMVAAEAARLPELGRTFYEYGAALLHERLEGYLSAEMSAGRLRTGPPRIAAMQFIGLVRGDLMLKALLCVDAGASERERQNVLRHGVDTFCRSWCTGPERELP